MVQELVDPDLLEVELLAALGRVACFPHSLGEHLLHQCPCELLSHGAHDPPKVYTADQIRM